MVGRPGPNRPLYRRQLPRAVQARLKHRLGPALRGHRESAEKLHAVHRVTRRRLRIALRRAAGPGPRYGLGGRQEACAQLWRGWSGSCCSLRCDLAYGDQNRVDDVLVVGAPAQIAGKRITNFGFVGFRVFRKKRCQRHQNARRAIAALQGMGLPKGLLQ